MGPRSPSSAAISPWSTQGPPTFALLLGLLATAPLAFVRPHLVPVAVTVTVANALTLAAGFVPTVAATIALVVVLYLVARQRPHRDWLLLLLPFAVLLAVPLGAVGGNEGAVAGLLTLTTVAGIVGSTARSRAESAARRESEEYLAGSLLEHAARGERARIARELHDVVAHHISMISIQAETARLTTPGMPPEGAKRLSAIGETAREALSEMRRLLGVLREDAETLADAGTPTGARRPGRPGRRSARDRQRCQHPAHRVRAGDPARAGGGAHGVPDRPGGADQLAAPRAGRGRGRRARLRRHRAATCGSEDNGPGHVARW